VIINKIWQKFNAQWKKREYIRNVSILAGGTAIGQGLVILVYPILTRIYNPQDFGILAVYVSVLTILRSLASLRYEQAIPLAEDDDVAYAVLWICLIILVMICLIIGVFLFLFGSVFLQWINTPELQRYTWLFPIGLLGMGSYQILNFWAIRKKAFIRIARTRLTQAWTEVIIQTILGLLNIIPIGLIIGHLAGQTAGSGSLSALVWGKQRQRKSNMQLSYKLLLQVANRYRRFPIFSSWATLLNSLALQIPVLILTAWYGTEVSGWYNLALRLFAGPAVIIGMSLAQVYVSESAIIVRGDDQNLHSALQLIKLMKKTVMISISIGLPLLLIAIISPWFFPIAFGEKWSEAGLYALPIGIMFFAGFIATPTGGTLDVLERQDLHLYREIIRLILLSSSIILAWELSASPRVTVICLCTAGTIIYIIYFIFSVYAIRTYRKKFN